MKNQTHHSEYLLEINKDLQELNKKGELNNPDTIAVLNLPSANICSNRGIYSVLNESKELICPGCITKKIKKETAMKQEEIKKVITMFAHDFGTKYITINGRGNPFDPRVVDLNMGKINQAKQLGVKSYVFTALNDLNPDIINELAKNEVNIMVSLYGNAWMDADFFHGKEYDDSSKNNIQNEKKLAENLRYMISTYKKQDLPDGITRIGFNYVVSEKDILDNGKKLKELKDAANQNGICFICNVPFEKNKDENIQKKLDELSTEYSNFHLNHTTAVEGQCQMGAGSAATVDFNGDLYRCPYMDKPSGDISEGNFMDIDETTLRDILKKYIQDREYNCVKRKSKRDA